MSTFYLYIILLFLIFLIEDLKRKGYSDKFGNRLIFIMVLLFSALRYDITRDYFNYVKLFTEIRLADSEVSELGYYYLNHLFSFSKYGFIFVFAFCSFVCVYSFHKTFVRLGMVDWGWFFSITLLVVLMMNNQIRQAVSMSIFTLALPYIEKRKFLKFSILMIVAMLFHFSAVICFPFYFAFQFFKKINPSKGLWLLLLLTTYFVYLSGVLYDFGIEVFKLFPQYIHYVDREFFSSRDEIKSGLGILLMLFLAIITILLKDKSSKRFIPYFNMAILYFLFFIIFSDLRVLQRVSRYLYIFVVVSFSHIMLSSKIIDYYKYILFTAALLWFGRYGYLSDRPYRTVFSDYCRKGVFFDREDGTKKGERELKKYINYDFVE